MDKGYKQLKQKLLKEENFKKANEILITMLKRFNKVDEEICEHMANILDQPIEENYYIRPNK